MHVWRITKYAPLDGKGAAMGGGRWNSPGLPVVYTASNAEGAVLELLAWVDPEDVPAGFVLYTVEIPDDIAVETLDQASLPDGWQAPRHPVCCSLGDEWLQSRRTAVLAVPSSILPEAVNYLVNPLHPAFPRVQVVQSRAFTFDPRLLR